MSDVFISYSRKNSEFVHKLQTALSIQKIDTWIDWDDIPKGTRWLQEIYNGIENADNFLIIISPESLTSQICNDEISHAIEYHKRIIPIIYRDVDQEALAGKWFEQEWEQTARQNWQYIRNINWLFFRDSDNFENAFQSLIETINQDIGHVRTHTRLTNRALEWDKSGRKVEFLLRGEDLRGAELWLATSETKQPKPTELQTQYILSSRQISNTRQRILVGALSTGLLVTLTLLIAALILAQDANVQRGLTAEKAATATFALGLSEIRGTDVAIQRDNASRNAEEAHSIALASSAQLNLANNQSSLALALALEANKLADAPQFSQITLYDAAYAPGTRWLRAGHSSWVWDIAISHSGQFALSASLAGDVVLWNMVTGAEIARFQHPHSETTPAKAIDDVAFSPNEQTFLSAGFDGLLILWDIETKQPLWKIDTREPLMSVALSPDGLAAITTGSKGTVTRWDLETLSPEWSITVDSKQTAVNRVVISADAKWALIGTDSGLVRLLDAFHGEKIRDFLGHTDRIFSIALSPDSRHILSGSRDGSMILWDLETTTLIHRFHHHSNVYQVLFSPNGRYAFSSSYDTSIHIWDLETYLPVRIFNDHPAPVSSLALSPDQHTLLSGDSDGNIRFIDLWRGDEMAQFSQFRDRVSSVAFSPDGQFVVSASFDASVKLWDVSNNTFVRDYVGHQSSVTSVAFSPNGRLLVSGDRAGIIIIWDVKTGQPRVRFLGHTEGISSITFTRDSKSVLSAGGHSEVFLWDAQTGGLQQSFIRHIQSHQFQPAIVLAVSPDGKQFASGDAEGQIFIWDLETYSLKWELEQQSESIRSLAFSPDSKLLLAGADTNARTSAVMLWDLAHITITKGQEPIKRYEGHSDAVWSVAFSPNQMTFLSGSADTTILLWDIQTGEVLRRITGHNEPVWSVAFNPQGDSFVSGSSDNTMRIWRIDTSSELQSWIRSNRYIPPFSCADRAQYQVEPLCPTNENNNEAQKV